MAGGFGLIGTVVGGGAAIWGARQQVRSQAAAEHSHWLRQMRREVYDMYLLGAYEVIDSFRLVVAATADGGPPEARQELERRLTRLTTLGTRVQLAGPTELDAIARQASLSLNRLGEELRSLRTADELASADLDPLLAEAAARVDAFSNAARRIIQQPPL